MRFLLKKSGESMVLEPIATTVTSGSAVLSDQERGT